MTNNSQSNTFRSLLWFLILFLSHQYPLYGQWEVKYHQGNSRVNKIRFKSAREGLFMGDHSIVLKTSDSGMSWDQMNVGSDFLFQDFQFLNDTLIIATGFEYEGAGRNIESRVFQSTDSGNTWATISVLPELQIYSQWFFNEQVGLLAGYDGIYRTSDHGETWTRTSLLSSLVDNELFFLNDSIGYVSAESKLLKSIDQGQTWVQVLNLENNLIHDIHFVTDRLGFLGAGGSIYRTHDGGDSWSEIPLVEFQATIDIDFVNENVGYALSAEICPCIPEKQVFHSAISMTRDGGLTWESHGFVGSLYSIDFIDEQLGYVSGEENVIMRIEGGDLGDFPQVFHEPIITKATTSSATPTIYPNPVRHKITIEVTDPFKEVHIYTLNGKAIDLPTENLGERLVVDFSSREAGIYFLHFRGPGITQVFKVIKE